MKLFIRHFFQKKRRKVNTMKFRPTLNFRSTRTSFTSYEAALSDTRRGSTSYSIFTTESGGTVSAQVFESSACIRGNGERIVILYRLQKMNKKSRQVRFDEVIKTPLGKRTNTEMTVLRRPMWIVDRVEIPERMIYSAKQNTRNFEIVFRGEK